VVRASAHRFRCLAYLLLPLALLGGVGTAYARPAKGVKAVQYHGYAVTVPRSWPVYHLDRDPGTCVRFNRHAVYLGIPGAQESCPAHAAGRAGAILLEPVEGSLARAGPSAARPAPSLEGSATSFVVRSARVEVTATWSGDRGAVARALHRRSLTAAGTRPPPAIAGHTASAGARPAEALYAGLGFDACSAPSAHAMTAWASSPYRAIGIYIGGANSACAQSNLTSSWVSSEVAAGWHLIPTYVGLQAPSNSCGCAGIKPSQASAEGTAAAADAVTQAQSLGIPAGNPIYDDMESYSRGGTNTSAVLAFLSAWTSGLHARGYLSGVYGNADSGMSDLVGKYGSGYPEPDDIWIANWNGEQTTSDPYVPSADWSNHQRLHQYRGGHNETYGGVTINIDNNYLDGATATTGGAGKAPPPVSAPTLVVLPTADGTTNLNASWSGGSGLTAWRALAGTAQSALTTVASTTAHGSQTTITVRGEAPYFAVQALGSSGQVLADSSTIATRPNIVLFGRSAFVNEATGVGGIPAGCYTGTTCHVATTISVGRTTIATTGPESIQPTGTGILYFKLAPQGRILLRRARRARLPVEVRSRDLGGSVATANIMLIPFSTSGRGPLRTVEQSTLVRAVGVTDFVFAHGSGGILAGCASVAACPIAATLSVGRVTIATTRPELVGGNELGYLFFSLTAEGRAMLERAPGNQLGASLTLSSGGSTATARIALVQFS